jgi:hypothetical protein
MVWDHPLKAIFSKLFSIARRKEALKSDHVQFSNRNLQWNISFTRSIHDWEVDLVTSFFDIL